MGVNIGGLVQVREVKLTDFAGRVIGLDGHNVTYQFLARIRKNGTGESLVDRSGRVTSHLSGILYRTGNLVEAGIKPLFVWDGKPPPLKERTIRERREIREQAEKRWVEAVKKGEEAFTFAQASSKLTREMVEEEIKLLEYMGIPSIQAPSEGEAQLAVMTRREDIWAGASQDWDSLLFDSLRLIRNLSITGRRKLPQKNVYVDIKPEIVELEKVLSSLSITREQLIIIGLLVGTDYNRGVQGVGPKTALRLVKEHKTLDRVVANIKWEDDVAAEKVFDFFLNPPATEDYKIKWKEPETEKIVELMVEEHDFSRNRIDKIIKILQENLGKIKEKSLESFF
ncbi:flap endonuclease-1 [Candidatus Bathyarchaeota archaeon]|nr:flap endonuclease-1 [Candidatus Bathyarchaeota archaeon]